MRFEMIDRDKRRAMHQCDRLRRRQPDDDAADQARAGRGRDAAERRIADPRLFHRRFDDAVEQVDMGARGDLRHHAAVRRVVLDLRVDDIGQNAAGTVLGPLDHGGGGLIAGCLDAQHQHLKKIPPKSPLPSPKNRRLPV